MIRVFVDNALLEEFGHIYPTFQQLNEMPEQAIIYFTDLYYNKHWYRKDLTPMLLSDVPKEVLTLNLLLN